MTMFMPGNGDNVIERKKAIRRRAQEERNSWVRSRSGAARWGESQAFDRETPGSTNLRLNQSSTMSWREGNKKEKKKYITAARRPCQSGKNEGWLRQATFGDILRLKCLCALLIKAGWRYNYLQKPALMRERRWWMRQRGFCLVVFKL